MTARILMLLTLAVVLPARGSVLFPAAVASCVANAACSAPAFVAAAADFDIYAWSQDGEPGYLLRYPLGAGSRENATSLAGDLWVGVAQHYDLAAGPHPVALYFDRVDPQPQNLWVGDSDGLDVQLLLPSDALLAGQAHYFLQDQGALVVGMGTLGDRFTFSMAGLPESFLPCLASGCAVEAAFVMVGYRYVAAGGFASLAFVPERGGLVYRQRRDYPADPGFGVTQSFAAVPLPGALGLLVGGVLLGYRRR